MQATARSVEREALRRLPQLLADLLDESSVELVEEQVSSGGGADVGLRDSRGRLWVYEIKTSSGPGQVERAAEQLKLDGHADAIPLLVVPFMSKAGSDAADRLKLNWIDLSGNASIRAENLVVWVQGHPNQFRSPGVRRVRLRRGAPGLLVRSCWIRSAGGGRKTSPRRPVWMTAASRALCDGSMTRCCSSSTTESCVHAARLAT